MFKSIEEFYEHLAQNGLDNEAREYLYSLPHREVVKILIEVDYRLWRMICRYISNHEDERNARYREEYAEVVNDITH